MKKLALLPMLLLLITIVLSRPLLAEEQRGPWYGSYVAPLGGIEIRIDLDQLSGRRSGKASISFIQAAIEPGCPREVHPELCSELKARARRSPNGSFFAEDKGVLYEGEAEAFVAFRFRDHPDARLLAIQRNKQDPQAAAIRIYHPSRGIDAHVDARRGRYLCEKAPCNRKTGDTQRVDPKAALGLFRTRSFLSGFNPRLDERAEAHRDSSSLERQNGDTGEFNGIVEPPGFTGLTFALRNVPAGRALVIRERPDRTSAGIGQLPASAADIHVSGCEPAIDQTRFAETSLDGKLELLGGTWCRISSRQSGVRSGYVLGRYLTPESR